MLYMSNFQLRVLVLLFLFLISLLISTSYKSANAVPSSNQYVFYRSWGGEGNQLRDPRGIAIDQNGRIYIANNGINRITVILPIERTMVTWGGFGSDDGEFSSPVDVAIDNNGNLFVVDQYNDRIQKFNSNGDYITKWGTEGSGNGQFDYPTHIAIDKYGNVYIVDYGNSRIQKFTNDGNYLLQWGQFGTGIGEFWDIKGIGVNSQDIVYVAESGNERIQKFSNNGVYLTQWAVDANSLTIDSANYVYALVGNTLQKYNDNGILLSEWVVPEVDSQISSNAEISVDGQGNIYLTDPYDDRIRKFNASGQNITQWQSEASDPGQFDFPWGIAVDRVGDIYVADSNNDRIQKFTASGTYLAEWESQNVHNITVANDGSIYAVRYSGYWIQKLDSNGELLLEWGDWWGSPSGIEVGNDNDVYMADAAASAAILKFNSNGEYLTEWGYNYGAGDGEFEWISGIDLDSNNNVYAVDQYLDRVQKFTSDGQYLYQWGSTGSEPGQFNDPNGIAVDNQGFIYIADSGNGRIQKFTLDGTYITEWDENSSGIEQFGSPVEIAVDTNGFVYVTERLNHRIQVFRPGYPTLDLVSGLIQNGSFEATPAFSEWTYGGDLLVSLSNTATHGDFSLKLGQQVDQTEQPAGHAWAHQTIYVDPTWDRPILSFRYNMFVNDLIDASDFLVAIQDGLGLNHLSTVLRDGYQPCIPNVPPAPATELGWRLHHYDLSAYRGQHVRFTFSNRNLHNNYSWGIWTYVDDVRVTDAGSSPSGGPNQMYLPTVLNQYDPSVDCDPVVTLRQQKMRQSP